MRFSTPVEYERISQALLKGTCPFCTYLKSYQSKIVRDLKHPEDIASACNFHMWAMAAASNRSVVSGIFRKLIKDFSMQEARACTLCEWISAEEKNRMKEFAADLSQARVREWMSAQGSFCLPHGSRFMAYLSQPMQALVSGVLRRNAGQLHEALEHLVREQDNAPGGGILGHVAEFLVSQRGLNV